MTETDTRMRGSTLKSTETLAAKESVPKKERKLSEKHIKERDERRAAKAASEKAISDQHDDLSKRKTQQAEARLQFLLKQSDLFAHFSGKGPTGGDMATSSASSSSSSTAGKRPDIGSPRRRGDFTEDDNADETAEQEDTNQGTYLSVQPACITGGQLRKYQLEGLNWMLSLNANGINGILADEMGLGKTLQSISVLAATKELKGVSGPHLVIVPKSTLSNWMNEFKRFCPSLRPIRFHGSKEERQDMLQNVLCASKAADKRTWDICITTYEVCCLERNSLIKFAWRYLIIDEAHRLKNEASQLAVAVRAMNVEHRLLLTGTPLQNNLHELWALLNFLLPDVFQSAEQFDEWFNLDVDDTEAKQRMIGQLHKLLRPFMLRRLKADVEKTLPPKNEMILFTGMSAEQKSLYKNILMRDIDAVNGAMTSKSEASRTAILNIVMQLRKCCNHPYLFPGIEDRSLDPLGDHLHNTCGKMALLHKLMKRLKEKGNRVLIFSQMTRMLDILEDYLISQRYLYCRIDGSTNYEDREDRIADYNREGSDKFCFLLSTRAGGLGINLQTADTVIIYDSDWNPQADLQAQDRAHRIGQKKPVSIFRLVTEDTVEVKVVERAQQKLKLDAMVVQQGRLADQEKKLSKSDLLDTLRFGADKIFRSKESSISDADIDAILEAGQKRTEEMNSKLQVNEKGDMLDFKLDGGTNTQVFEGTDYSMAAQREREKENNAMFPLAGMFIDPGKRERKTVATYSDSMSRMVEETAADKRPKLPRHLRLPKMEDWMFFNRERLTDLSIMENEIFEKKVDDGLTLVVGQISQMVVLSPELHAEKQKLLKEGFGDWTKVHFNNFLRASAKYGRDDIFKITKEMGRPQEEVSRFAQVFWSCGSTTFEAADWDRYVKQIEKGEKKREEISRLTDATEKLIRMFRDPWEELSFRYVGNQGRIFNSLEDRYLLCLTQLHGYGAWDRVRDSIRRCEKFRFDYFIQSCSIEALGKRCETLMRSAERELNEIEKKKSSGTSLQAVNAAAVHEENIAKANKLDKIIKEEARKLAAAKQELKLGQAPSKTALTDKLLKNAKKSGAADALQSLPVDSGPVVAPKVSGGGGRTGKEPKSIPEENMPRLVQLIEEMMASNIPSIVTKFVEEFPDVSKRQVQIKVTEITIKKPKYEIVPGSKSTMGIYVVAPEVDIPGVKSKSGGETKKGKAKSDAKGKGAKKDAQETKPKKKRKKGDEAENGSTGADNANADSDGKTPAKKSKKPVTSFNLFVKQSRPEVERSFAHITETSERTKAIKADLMARWNNLTPENLQKWDKLAEEANKKQPGSNPASPSRPPKDGNFIAAPAPVTDTARAATSAPMEIVPNNE